MVWPASSVKIASARKLWIQRGRSFWMRARVWAVVVSELPRVASKPSSTSPCHTLPVTVAPRSHGLTRPSSGLTKAGAGPSAPLARAWPPAPAATASSKAVSSVALPGGARRSIAVIAPAGRLWSAGHDTARKLTILPIP